MACHDRRPVWQRKESRLPIIVISSSDRSRILNERVLVVIAILRRNKNANVYESQTWKQLALHLLLLERYHLHDPGTGGRQRRGRAVAPRRRHYLVFRQIAVRRR